MQRLEVSGAVRVCVSLDGKGLTMHHHLMRRSRMSRAVPQFLLVLMARIGTALPVPFTELHRFILGEYFTSDISSIRSQLSSATRRPSAIKKTAAKQGALFFRN
jgi:hypothetical protein